MIRRPPRSTLSSSSAASDVYKRQEEEEDVFPLTSDELAVLVPLVLFRINLLLRIAASTSTTTTTPPATTSDTTIASLLVQRILGLHHALAFRRNLANWERAQMNLDERNLRESLSQLIMNNNMCNTKDGSTASGDTERDTTLVLGEVIGKLSNTSTPTTNTAVFTLLEGIPTIADRDESVMSQLPFYPFQPTAMATPTSAAPVSYTHLRAHETPEHLVCRLLLEKKKNRT
eukprot:TRINITY_DN22142_c0_g2_i2.p1 TRINITY_DN22142_c0_g2~~TRINITY_DN22142_c0_g2_i2.p1  ORF type:complete len:231 (-),score=66.47 TRINITY_DN22142_c0_g2_i2:44-736(-)